MDTSRFIICRASAGSGKTYTLVRQYLELAFSATGDALATRFSRILAITFTNKAANEMKERILRELNTIALKGADYDMGADLALALGIDGDTLRQRAAIVTKGILHNYSDFAVCTIDSFMHGVVRTFAHDLNLPMAFDVYLDSSDLIQNAVDELMDLTGTEGQEELTEVLCEFAERRMEDDKSYRIDHSLKTLAKELFKEDTPRYLSALKELHTDQFRHIHSEMTAQNRAYEQRLKALGQKAIKAIADAGLNDSDFYQGAKGAGTWFRKLANGTVSNPNSYVTDFLEGDKLGSGKTSPDTRQRLADVKPLLQPIFSDIQQHRADGERLYNTRKLLLKNIYSLALINKLNELVGSFSRQNEILHISEFNKRIAQVVQNEPTPFIYERLGNRYLNYLIDEFQDTSRMQWQNLVPLLENGVGAGHTSLVVGDGKQAIYRFRQGEVGQFIALPHVDNPVHGRLLEHPGISQISRLEKNFRTAATVVNFNNDFFEWTIRNRFGSNPYLTDIYIGQEEGADLLQQPVKQGGYVQAAFVDLDKDHTPLWQEIVRDIQSLTAQQGFRYRDIMLMARKKKVLAEISSYLQSAGIPVVSSESFLLSQSRVVMVLDNLLHYLLDYSNRVAAAKVLLGLKSLGLVKANHAHQFIERYDAVPLESILLDEGLELNCARLRSLDLYDCCEEAIRMLHLNGLETSYAATFLNEVSKYSNNHRQDLAEFLEWFDEKRESLSTSTASELDAIKLMTIHKAKGLEAPIVLYPILNEKDQTDDIWVETQPADGLPLPAALVTPKKDCPTLFDNQYNDEVLKREMDAINILYVALTRPREKLMLYCQQPPKESGNGYTSLLSDYLTQRDDTFEVRPGVLGIGTNSPNASSASAQPAPNGPVTHPINHISFPSWQRRITIAEQSQKLFGQLDNAPIRLGNHMHELLAHIKSANDADRVLPEYLQLNPMPPDESALIQNRLHAMLRHPEVARFFNPDYPCINECDIAFNGTVIRPDRIVFTPTEVWVVDFKTGAQKTEHITQVLHYCDALQAMGHPSVKGYLIYLQDDNCQVVTC